MEPISDHVFMLAMLELICEKLEITTKEVVKRAEIIKYKIVR